MFKNTPIQKRFKTSIKNVLKHFIKHLNKIIYCFLFSIIFTPHFLNVIYRLCSEIRLRSKFRNDLLQRLSLIYI